MAHANLIENAPKGLLRKLFFYNPKSSLWQPKQEGVWKKITFTVPADTPDERVQFVADKYRNKAGHELEARGWRVLEMTWPIANDLSNLMVDPDRRGYQFWAFVSRRPVEVKIEVPGERVPELERLGWKPA